MMRDDSPIDPAAVQRRRQQAREASQTPQTAPGNEARDYQSDTTGGGERRGTTSESTGDTRGAASDTADTRGYTGDDRTGGEARGYQGDTTRGDARGDRGGTTGEDVRGYTGDITGEDARGSTSGDARDIAAQRDESIQQPRGQGQEVSGIRDLSIWDSGKADEFRHRWHDVQTHFVEDPRGSVTEARQLVDDAMRSLSDSVHDREEQLERTGARSSDSTEGMRDTVLQYHHLLDRLLAV
ncbi:hypothetical protein [Dactylosporangium sp. NPDC005555]|uniref:hypothetical protein n=1 Tax=Dactylosporangium sp. NPDC005555 TaxID=3154889 RepID=UPI0033A295BB